MLVLSEQFQSEGKLLTPTRTRRCPQYHQAGLQCASTEGVREPRLWQSPENLASARRG